MATMQDLFTRRDYEQLPTGFPAQLVAGALVREPAPSYGHQSVSMRLLRMLVPLVPDGLLLAAPVDVVVDELNVFQPDIVVLAAPPSNRERSDVGLPRLAIEVLSPRTAERDRDVKTRRLLEAGVEEVWLVDPVARTVERCGRGGRLGARGDEEIGSAVVAGFRVVPRELFRP